MVVVMVNVFQYMRHLLEMISFFLVLGKGFFCFLFSTFRLLLFESLYPVTLVKQRVSKASFLSYTSGVIFQRSSKYFLISNSAFQPAHGISVVFIQKSSRITLILWLLQCNSDL